jgi:deoxyribonuclease V
VDVHYKGSEAVAAAVIFPNWNSESERHVHVENLFIEEAYVPGQFYKRELPCLLAVLARIKGPLSTIVVDGYVALGKEKRAGLGLYLYQALEEATPVIGVAKNYFSGTPAESKIYRGQSQRPLWITAAGVDVEYAKRAIRTMHGNHRLPHMLKRVDQLCRGI